MTSTRKRPTSAETNATRWREITQARYQRYIAEQGEEKGRAAILACVARHQAVLYAMVGGNLIGAMYAEQPADAYVDDRVGRLPYTRREIEKARRVLVVLAQEAGLDPHDLPRLDLTNLDVF
jgi:predicted Zn-dependent protease